MGSQRGWATHGYAVLSDVHGNPPALRAALTDIRRCGFETLVFLGDAVNGAAPRECLIELLAWPGELLCIKGNAEDNVCTRNVTGFPWHNDPRWAWLVPKITWWQRAVGEQLLETICAWPHELILGDALAIHHSPPDLRSLSSSVEGLPPAYRTLVFHGRGIRRDRNDAFFQQNITELRARDLHTMFVGHTHEQWLIEDGDVAICNVGSVGMPLDGDTRAAWASWTPNEGIELHRVAYDLRETLAMIERTTMPMSDRAAHTQMFQHARHWKAFVSDQGSA